MRPVTFQTLPYQCPMLQHKANDLADYLRSLSVTQLERHMQLSKMKAEQTHALLQDWTDEPSKQRPAIDAFLGDIYSGLQVQSFDTADRAYANDHLLILSGLYGGLRALDSVYPYRLEMGYKLPKSTYAKLYDYWGDSIAKLIPRDNVIVNLSAVEYTKALLPYLANTVITPKFMTISKKIGGPTFVTVHAKIARGAFANWLIKNRLSTPADLTAFNELGYSYVSAGSTEDEPLFVCTKFEGLGLSVRLS